MIIHLMSVQEKTQISFLSWDIFHMGKATDYINKGREKEQQYFHFHKFNNRRII